MTLQRLAQSLGSPFGAPPHALALPYLARVTSVDDPDGLARVRVELYAFDTDRDVAIWARVAVPFAGSDNGAFLIPNVGDEVLILFVGGDTRAPVVIGSLWNGSAKPPESTGSTVDRWTFTGTGGTRIAIVEDGGDGTIVCETPTGITLEMKDQGGGSVEIVCGANRLKMDTSGIAVTASAKVSVEASSVEVTASTVTVNAAFSSFSGVVECDTLITQSVVSASYTPGAGNVW
jgi:uncharacterized protein involved in type VI secretion and phage assembly